LSQPIAEKSKNLSLKALELRESENEQESGFGLPISLSDLGNRGFGSRSGQRNCLDQGEDYLFFLSVWVKNSPVYPREEEK